MSNTRRYSPSLAHLRNTIKSSEQKQKFQADTRFWKPTPDANGNTKVTLRFLPAPVSDGDGEQMPWVKLYRHIFDGPGGKYFENCRRTLGKDERDPVMDHNRELWNTGNETLKQQVRKQARQTRFIRNILVIDDQGKPENNGKLFLYSYPKQIHDKILAQLDEELNPFDLETGSNFILKVKRKGGGETSFPTYEDSIFGAPSKLFDGDSKKIDALMGKVYDLQPLVAPDQFKSYDDLQKRLNTVLRLSNPIGTAADPSRPASRDAADHQDRPERPAGPSLYRPVEPDDEEIPF